MQGYNAEPLTKAAQGVALPCKGHLPCQPLPAHPKQPGLTEEDLQLGTTCMSYIHAATAVA